jgi:acetylornithine deacetylase
VADEEFESAGTRALVDWMAAEGVRPDACVITEPTRLAVMPAHRGFAWYTVTLRGRAAHGSRYDIGVDAIRHAGLVLAELDRLDADELPPARRTRCWAAARCTPRSSRAAWGSPPTPSAACSASSGARSRARARTGVLGELRAACERAGARPRARGEPFRAEVALDFAQPPSDVAPAAPVVRALADALAGAGEAVRVEGMPAWTDAALLNAAGIPTVCFGPGDIGLAHAATEWVELAEVERAADVLEELVRAWCG